MGFKKTIRSLFPFFSSKLQGGIGKFAFDHKTSVLAEIQNKYGYDGDLLTLFTNNKGNVVNKWHHYIPLYDRYFSPYRGKNIRILEIGVHKGGSLQLWRKYFGENAVIFGIDIDPECSKFNGQSAQVRIGSQADKYFLEAVIKEMGGVDIVLDDGSHQMEHIKTSLECLFPLLNDGGIYMIEDLHTAYWATYGGGYYSKQNFYCYVNDLINDMHHWYHKYGQNQVDISNNCTGIHIHDSMVVIDKNLVHRPAHSQIGN